MNIINLISMSVLLTYIVPIILYIYTHNFIHIIAFTGSIITTIISETLKYTIIKDLSVRPKGASDCNLLCNDGIQSGEPGMPSSHSANIAFFTGYYFQVTDNIIIRIVLTLFALGVMVSRYLKRCHTINQIVVGAILGLSLSWIAVRHL